MDECPICLETGGTSQCVSQCSAAFHPGCIEGWLRTSGTCPACTQSWATWELGESVAIPVIPVIVVEHSVETGLLLEPEQGSYPEPGAGATYLAPLCCAMFGSGGVAFLYFLS